MSPLTNTGAMKLRTTSTTLTSGSFLLAPEKAVKPVEPVKKPKGDSNAAAEESVHLREQVVTVWILVAVLLLLSFFAGYVLCAKVTSSWPFQF